MSLVYGFHSWNAVRPELSWTHYRVLLRVENSAARAWYMDEAAGQHWSSRALERQIGTLYYERLLSSREKDPVAAEAQEKTQPLTDDPKDFLRDPYILDFLNLDASRYQEADLEQGIINNLQQFLLEMGKGFAFVERQQLFASKYLTVLPSEEELQRERRIVEQRIEEQRGKYHF